MFALFDSNSLRMDYMYSRGICDDPVNGSQVRFVEMGGCAMVRPPMLFLSGANAPNNIKKTQSYATPY